MSYSSQQANEYEDLPMLDRDLEPSDGQHGSNADQSKTLPVQDRHRVFARSSPSTTAHSSRTMKRRRDDGPMTRSSAQMAKRRMLHSSTTTSQEPKQHTSDMMDFENTKHHPPLYRQNFDQLYSQETRRSVEMSVAHKRISRDERDPRQELDHLPDVSDAGETVTGGMRQGVEDDLVMSGAVGTAVVEVDDLDTLFGALAVDGNLSGFGGQFDEDGIPDGSVYPNTLDIENDKFDDAAD